MKEYIGVKLIKAEPQDNEDGEPGYKVVYPDGYKSWSPKDVFEEAYRPTTGVTFGLAIEAMRKGMSAILPHWSGDVFIQIQTPDTHSKMTAPYFYVSSRYGQVPWIPTMVEMLSDEWCIR